MSLYFVSALKWDIKCFSSILIGAKFSFSLRKHWGWLKIPLKNVWILSERPFILLSEAFWFEFWTKQQAPRRAALPADSVELGPGARLLTAAHFAWVPTPQNNTPWPLPAKVACTGPCTAMPRARLTHGITRCHMIGIISPSSAAPWAQHP